MVDKNFSPKFVLLIAAALLCLFLVPTLTAIIAILICALQLLLASISAVRSGSRSTKDVVSKSGPGSTPPILSVQVPAHNEPPDVLIATLASLQRQCASPDAGVPAHEVMVIVNNTANPALWKPVEAWCATAGPRFRFIRRDGVFGAKAGALNIALDMMNREATHVVVIDADYVLAEGFLATVSAKITELDTDFIQFPQAYRHGSPRTAGLSYEMADYFNRHARAANIADAMLLTGTLSVIRASALRDVGGWPCRSCTEDAELGSRLIAAGYAGRFVEREVGAGLMPLDLDGLHKQRHRWAAGNAQVLVATILAWMTGESRRSSVLHKSLIVSQLAAWLNLGGFAVVLLCLATIQRAMGAGIAASVTAVVTMVTILIIFGAAILPLLMSADQATRWPVRRDAVVSRIAVLPVCAVATIAGLIPGAQRFHVTRKGIVPKQGPAWNLPLILSGLSGAALLTAGIALPEPAALLAGVLLILPLICAVFCQHALGLYAADVALQER